MQFPLKNIQFEISGICNAKCPYCITGQKNLRKEKTGKFITVSEFKKGLEWLYSKKIINSKTIIALFNYGEPLLNPNFEEIIDVLNFFGNKYEISTNGSILLEENLIKKMKGLLSIQFSMCGMSQYSYDKIHGFSAEKIKVNVMKMVEMLHELCPDTECILKLQVYSFNENEVLESMLFATKMGMNVIPIHALYANLQQQIDFVEKFKKTKQLPRDSEQLWYYLPELLDREPKDITCPQQYGLVMDEELNIALCCMVTKSMEEYKLCNLLELKPDILRERNNNSFCKRCIGIGASRSICSPPSYKKKTRYDSILEKNKHKKMIIIGTGALVQSFKNFYDKDSCCEVKNMFDEASLDMLKRDSNVFYILANREWWKMRIDLEQHGLQEDIDFMVYNTYYR